MIFLLRIDLDGMQPLYYADQPCAPEQDGAALVHEGTLEPPDFSEAVSWGSAVAGPASASCTIRADLPTARGLNVIHFPEGHRLESATAELSVWHDGDAYSARDILIAGRFLVDKVPIQGRPVTGTLTQRVLDKAKVYPPATAIATTTTWPDIPVAEGTAYPAFLGVGGAYVKPNGSPSYVSCLQGILVDPSPLTLLLSYGWLVCTTMLIRSVENATTQEFDMVYTTDALGQPVTVAKLATVTGGGASTWTWAGSAADDTFLSDLITGGLPTYDRVGAVVGLGEAIVWLLLQRYSPEGVGALVDLAAWSAVRPYLDQTRIGLLLSGGDPWDDVQALMKYVPELFVLPGPRGLRPVLLRPLVITEAPLLVANRDDQYGPDLYRMPEQEATWVGAEIVNAVDVNFAHQLYTGKFRATLSIAAAEHPGAASSTSRNGVRTLSVDCPALWTIPAAARVAGSYLRLRGVQVTQDSWFAPQGVGETMTLGSPWRIRDDQAGYDDRLMYVIARETVHVGSAPFGWLVTLIDLGD